jgi:hypothetical protein
MTGSFGSLPFIKGGAMLFEEADGNVNTPMCSKCKGYSNSNYSYMEMIGRGDKILFVTDDFNKNPKESWLAPRMERFIKDICEDLKLNYNTDCGVVPAYKCDGNDKGASFCHFPVCNIIQSANARSVVLLGKNALVSVVGSKWKRDIGELDKWIGFTIPIYDRWIIPTYNPFQEYGNEFVIDNHVPTKILFENITKANDYRNHPITSVQKTAKIKILSENESVILLESMKEDCPLSAFDYETTGLRPYNKGHSIETVSVAFKRKDVLTSYAFTVSDKNSQAIKDYLQNGNLKKIASNMKFEDTWSKVIFGVGVKGWVFDTMLAQHIIDCREGICSLKFQAFVRYGFEDYEAKVKPFLIAKDASSLNNIKNCSYPLLLKYNAIDSYLEYVLAEDMMNELGVVI